MPMSIKHSGVWKEAEVHVKHSGVWKRAEVWVKQSGIWKLAGEVAAAIVHVLSPSVQNKSSTTGASFFAVSSQVTGGTPTSYSWGFVSTTDGAWAISAPTSANTNINVSAVPGTTTATAEVYCDAVVDGVTYRATGIYNYTNTSFV